MYSLMGAVLYHDNTPQISKSVTFAQTKSIRRRHACVYSRAPSRSGAWVFLFRELFSGALPSSPASLALDREPCRVLPDRSLGRAPPGLGREASAGSPTALRSPACCPGRWTELQSRLPLQWHAPTHAVGSMRGGVRIPQPCSASANSAPYFMHTLNGSPTQPVICFQRVRSVGIAAVNIDRRKVRMRDSTPASV